MNFKKITDIQWKAGFPHHGVDPEKAYREIMAIRKRNGGPVSPKDIIVAATPKRSILHPLLEWDDREAGRKLRRIQAGQILRSITVEYADPKIGTVRALEIKHVEEESPSSESETVYDTLEEIAKDPASRAYHIEKATQALRSWRNRYKLFSEFEKVFAVIDDVIDELVPVA